MSAYTYLVPHRFYLIIKFILWNKIRYQKEVKEIWSSHKKRSYFFSFTNFTEGKADDNTVNAIDIWNKGTFIHFINLLVRIKWCWSFCIFTWLPHATVITWMKKDFHKIRTYVLTIYIFLCLKINKFFYQKKNLFYKKKRDIKLKNEDKFIYNIC